MESIESHELQRYFDLAEAVRWCVQHGVNVEFGYMVYAQRENDRGSARSLIGAVQELKAKWAKQQDLYGCEISPGAADRCDGCHGHSQFFCGKHDLCEECHKKYVRGEEFP